VNNGPAAMSLTNHSDERAFSTLIAGGWCSAYHQLSNKLLDNLHQTSATVPEFVSEYVDPNSRASNARSTTTTTRVCDSTTRVITDTALPAAAGDRRLSEHIHQTPLDTTKFGTILYIGKLEKYCRVPSSRESGRPMLALSLISTQEG
jgi:hypothetical protein